MARIDKMEEKEGLDFIKKSVVEVEAVRMQEMKNLEMIQQVKQSAMEVEAERLTLKYGKEHPQVLKLTQRIAYNRQMLPALNQEIQRTAPNNDIPEDDTYRVQGRVFDGKLKPVANITVFLTDEKRNWVRELGNYCTADDGFYRFTFNEEMVKRLQQMNIYLAASDANQKLLCSSQLPLTIQLNQVEFRDIYLGTKNCAPPPGGNNRRDDVIVTDDIKLREDAKLKEAEELKRRTEEEAKRKAEDEAKNKDAEDRKRRAEEEAKLKEAEELKRRTEEEAKRKAEDEAKIREAEDRKRRAEEEAKHKEAEERKRRAEEEARLKAEEEAKRKAEEERKRKEEEDKKTRDDNNVIRPDRDRLRPVKGVSKKAAPKKAAPAKKAVPKDARKKKE